MDFTTTSYNVLHQQMQESRVLLPKNAQHVEHIFECPVCTEFMCGLVHICVRGHGICENCFHRVTNCPLCRGEMSAARNQFMESFMDHCSFRCRFAEQGCNAMVEGHAYNIHLQQCNYRDVQCEPILGISCATISVNYNHFLHHLKVKHRILTLKNGFQLSSKFPKGKRIENSELPFAMVEYDNKIFFYNCAKCTDENVSGGVSTGNDGQFSLCWWVSVFGADGEEQDYYCTVTLRSRHDKGPQRSWTGAVKNFRTCSQLIYASKDRLAVSCCDLHTLCLPDPDNSHFIYSYVEKAVIFKKSHIDSQFLHNAIVC